MFPKRRDFYNIFTSLEKEKINLLPFNITYLQKLKIEYICQTHIETLMILMLKVNLIETTINCSQTYRTKSK